MEITHEYDDIIHLPHHLSETRAHMPMLDRAAQFSPFAALTGYDEEIGEAGRLTDSFHEPSEEIKAILDGKLQLLEEKREERPEITLRYFQPDDRKAGGEYLEVTGRFRRVDAQRGTVQLLTEGEMLEIPLSQVADIRMSVPERDD